jgi:molybdopterin-biosynthesis enzyme MoeA-like protein
MTAKQTTFGAVIVGDELLSGKRRDGHFDFLVNALAQRGGQLSWLRMIGDDIAAQAQTYRESIASHSVVFSFGGIGATPDDLSRQAAAEAFDRELEYHPDGLKLLQARFGEDFTQRRHQLINFPTGVELIPNPVNEVPGFSLFNHHFVPGFPNMAHPMVEWVLDTHYEDVFRAPPKIEHRLLVTDVWESDLIPMMEKILAEHDSVKVSCLPQSKGVAQAELGIKAERKYADLAYQQLCELLDEAQFDYRAIG